MQNNWRSKKSLRRSETLPSALTLPQRAPHPSQHTVRRTQKDRSPAPLLAILVGTPAGRSLNEHHARLLGPLAQQGQGATHCAGFGSGSKCWGRCWLASCAACVMRHAANEGLSQASIPVGFEPTPEDPKVSLRHSEERNQRKTAPLARSPFVLGDCSTRASRESLIWHNVLGARNWPVQSAPLVHLEIGGVNKRRRFLFLPIAFGGAGRKLLCSFLLKFCMRVFFAAVLGVCHPTFRLSTVSLQLYTLTILQPPPPPPQPLAQIPSQANCKIAHKAWRRLRLFSAFFCFQFLPAIFWSYDFSI